MFFIYFQYKATDLVFPGNGKFEIVFTPEGGQPQTTEVFTFKKGGGCGMAMYNTDEVRINPIMAPSMPQIEKGDMDNLGNKVPYFSKKFYVLSPH